VNPIWKTHWPPGLDESRIRLPQVPLPAFLTGNARRAPDKPALVFYGLELAFGELDDLSDRFAGWLARRGIRPGDRIAIFLENCPQFAIAYYGADIGRVDAEGYFTIEERKKDMIKASGHSVFPAEVEAIMYRHPAVAEVGVVGVPDPYRGEDVLAFVVLRPGAGASEAELVAWCRAEMAVYKAPRAIRLVPALPKTGSGKILERALREQARQG
jgi:acyl-CoA synthetase (AMP-forming)/AMP-acid ligase II